MNQKSNDTDRKRRWRQRQAAGVVVVQIAVGPPLAAKLVSTNWLAEPVSDQRDAIAKALAAMLEDLAASPD